MGIIKTHTVTLRGGNETWRVVLRPFCDAHLPYLCKWCADPDVTYYTEGVAGLRYGEAAVRDIYGGVSQNALCFLVEANGVPVGECWLQRMNLPDVLAMYPAGTDVRRIDMSIDEKAYWNRGIGSIFIRMLVDFAFRQEHVDVLHCLCDDFNVRSERMWQKNGFTLVRRDAVRSEVGVTPVGKWRLHYALSKEMYFKEGKMPVC